MTWNASRPAPGSDCSTYYDNFQDFKAAITACLEQTHTTYKQELDTLLTLRFQSFEKS